MNFLNGVCPQSEMLYFIFVGYTVVIPLIGSLHTNKLV